MRQYHLYSILALKKRAKGGGRNFSPVEHTTIYRLITQFLSQNMHHRYIIAVFKGGLIKTLVVRKNDLRGLTLKP